jgi:hypothetical protein
MPWNLQTLYHTQSDTVQHLIEMQCLNHQTKSIMWNSFQLWTGSWVLQSPKPRINWKLPMMVFWVVMLCALEEQHWYLQINLKSHTTITWIHEYQTQRNTALQRAHKELSNPGLDVVEISAMYHSSAYTRFCWVSYLAPSCRAMVTMVSTKPWYWATGGCRTSRALPAFTVTNACPSPCNCNELYETVI